MLLSDKELLIGDHNYQEHAGDAVVDGERKGRGYVPRDFQRFPVGCYPGIPAMKAVNFPLIPRSEWSERCADQIKAKARGSDVILRSNGGQGYPSLDQNGQGYCWFYSGTGAIMATRAKMNEPYVFLSAHAGAWVIKGGRNEGGWGAQGVEFQMKRGVPSVEFWPEKSMNGRQYDNEKTWENAKLHVVEEGWMDMEAAQYDRNLTFEQFATCSLLTIFTVEDFDWWGHSVFGCDLVDGSTMRKRTRMANGKLATLKQFEAIWALHDPVTAGFGRRIRNSWTDGWGERGFSVLTGSKAIPVGGCALRSVRPSVA